MIQLNEIIRQLAASAEAVRALVAPVSDEQAEWKPDAETWSLVEVMGHLYNEERLDFRRHLKEMWSDPPQAWGVASPKEPISVGSCQQGLEGFAAEREASLAWLRSLQAPAWDVTLQAPFGPGGDVLTFSAGDVLVSWLAHDYLHIRQINELLYAWAVRQASPYSVDYAGGW
ncbi:MAG: DinB family protein [Anaerolineae bacterium]|nr:DinB family protein [Anaerolineae bacterium]